MLESNILKMNLAQNRYLNRAVGAVMGKYLFKKMNSFSQGDPAKIYVMVSFDCDRPEDTQALGDLSSLLSQYNIPCSIAVTAALIEGYENEYKNFFSCGHELLNHGYSLHTNTNERKKIYSEFYYHDADSTFIENEIAKAQDVYQNLLGVCPKGFRVPHFGTFQNKEKMLMLYNVLKKQGFAYSSSLMCFPMKQYGWSFSTNGIVEFPLSNRVSLPYSVVDSHTLIYTQSRLNIKNRFFKEFRKMLDVALENEQSTIINFYADPSQVTYEEQFENALEYAYSKGSLVEFVTYGQFVHEVLSCKDELEA